MKGRKRYWVGLVILIVITPLLFFGSKGIQMLRTLGDGNPVAGWQGLQNPRGEFPNQSKVVVLLIGKDYNWTDRGYRYSASTRADTIMLLGMDLERRTVSAVSVPRDLRVKAPDGGVGKINGTYTRGKEKLLVATLEQTFGLKVDYTIALRADAVKNIVDALGGVTVTTIDEMKYDDRWGQLHIDLPKGTIRINGEQAVGYTRFREVKTKDLDENGRWVTLRNVKRSLEEGDQRRTERQQLLVRAMIAEAMQPHNLIRADQVIDIGMDQIDTTLRRSQMLALATIFRSGVSSMKTATLETTPRRIDGIEYLVMNERKARGMVDWLIKGDDKAAKRALRVTVFNGSQTKGVAKQFAEHLRGQGFDVSVGGNTPQISAQSEILFAKAAYLEFVDRIAQDLGGCQRQKITIADRPHGLIPQGDLMVVIGEDRAGELRNRLTTSNRNPSPDTQSPRS